jgi:hypothetical protein
MTTNYPETKERMINEIVKYSDFYRSKKDLENIRFNILKSIYNACMIPLFKARK